MRVHRHGLQGADPLAAPGQVRDPDFAALPTPERRERLTLSRRLFTNPSTFVVPANSNYTFTKEGLRGKGIKIGLQRGAATVKWVQDRFGDAIEYSFYDNPDQDEARSAGRPRQHAVPAQDQRDDRADHRSPKARTGSSTAASTTSARTISPKTERGLAWAVRKGDDALIKRMNAALDSIIADCTYTTIRKKYLDITTSPEDAACVAKGM